MAPPRHCTPPVPSRSYNDHTQRCRSMSDVPKSVPKTSFAETALRMGGKSDEEARRLGAVDAADEQVELLFAPQYQTNQSPIHRAVWDGKTPLDLFAAPPLPAASSADDAMNRSLALVRRRKESKTLFDAQNK